MRLSIALFIAAGLAMAAAVLCRGQNNGGRPSIPLITPNTNTLNNGLVFYYKMDEASGNRADSGPNGLTLTDNNTVASAAGIITNSASYNPASSESLTHTDDPLYDPGDTDFTFVLWVYPDFTGFSRVVFGKDGASNKEYYIRHLGGGNNLSFGVSGNGTTYTTIGGSIPLSSANTWYFVAAFHSSVSNTINIRINGSVPNSTAHTTGCIAGNAELSVGLDADISNPWSGRIDEFGMWSRVLTTAELDYLYASGTPGSGQTCCPFP